MIAAHKAMIIAATILTREPMLIAPPKMSRRVAFRAVEVVEVLGLDNVETRIGQPLLERDDLRRGYSCTFAGVCNETATPVIDGERVGESARINFHAAIRDVEKFESVAVHAFDLFTQFIRDTVER